jgi:thiol-disulfide isomerase/thioredoxin
MRARGKRRRTYRRIVIVGVIVGILLLLILGFYFAYTASNQLEPGIGKPVSQADIATLKQLSLAPYGPSGASMLSDVKGNSGSPLTAHGKPVVVYIGADYCPYCAVQRWSLIMALMRFGNFSNLSYMASSPSEGDYPTFTFHDSSYTSMYLIFHGYEQEDRNNQPQDTVPSNYTSLFQQYNSYYPFINFGNKYVISGAMVDPTPLGGENWAGVFKEINAGTTLGTQIKESANVITAVICKLTGNQPGSVCNQNPINGLTLELTSYSPTSQGTFSQAGVPSSFLATWAAVPASDQRE